MTGSYKAAGVDLDAGDRTIELIRRAVASTYGPAVLAGIGAFGGLFEAAALRAHDDTVLVASTDGVGTKTLLAAQLGLWRGIGHDIVNHCVNDILVQGARPLFFLDYIAAARLDPQTIAEVVTGIAEACRAVGAALLGGETAEMPGVYRPGAFDLVGTIVGVVRRSQIIDGSRIREGDAIIGLASSGLHTNGYSLARAVFEKWDLRARPAGLEQTLGEALLAPHTCYLEPIRTLQQARIDIHGLAHITGGGIPGNLPRILPPQLGAEIEWGSWPVPALFGLLRRAGQISGDEMFRVFNMGLGMLVVLPAEECGRALALLGDGAYRVGRVVRRQEGEEPVAIR
ncbi:MAG: phosphoribosylformylglycinamidine cyclo-ligase [Caldilineae bacterium]|nr:MAG: phosphoribosylformylglycinamidine cyclo-ligase [Caldilineae bacterium]